MGSPKPCVSILTWSNFGRFGGGAFVGNLHLNLYKLPSQQPYLKNGLWNPQEEGICSLSTLVATGQTSQSFLGFWHGAPALALLVPVELPATKSGKVRVLQHRYRTLQEIWDLCNIMHTYIYIHMHIIHIYMQYNVTLLSAKIIWIRLEGCWELLNCVECYFLHLEYLAIEGMLNTIESLPPCCVEHVLITHLKEIWYQDYSQCVFQWFKASLQWNDCGFVSDPHATLNYVTKCYDTWNFGKSFDSWMSKVHCAHHLKICIYIWYRHRHGYRYRNRYRWSVIDIDIRYKQKY